MQYGPNSVYQCPNCEEVTVRRSLRSGNTFGAVLFSDGKLKAPMLRKFTKIVKCKKCGAFYWLKNENKIAQYDVFDSKKRGEWRSADQAAFLSVSEYIEAINLKIGTTEEQKYLRTMLWWKFNDRIRDGGDIFTENNDKEAYESNCIELIKLLDKNNDKEKILIAELCRNLGNYIECNAILETIEDQKYLWIKELLQKECAKNNPRVVALRR
jgi:predicted RNA-binding Zn-ribbon protein involved in translation (DUF1610 family)